MLGTDRGSCPRRASALDHRASLYSLSLFQKDIFPLLPYASLQLPQSISFCNKLWKNLTSSEPLLIFLFPLVLAERYPRPRILLWEKGKLKWEHIGRTQRKHPWALLSFQLYSNKQPAASFTPAYIFLPRFLAIQRCLMSMAESEF